MLERTILLPTVLADCYIKFFRKHKKIKNQKELNFPKKNSTKFIRGNVDTGGYSKKSEMERIKF